MEASLWPQAKLRYPPASHQLRDSESSVELGRFAVKKRFLGGGANADPPR
jgi:hypothetical protein